MADAIYNRFKYGLMNGDFDLKEAGDDVRVALVTSSYTPDIDTHVDYGDITNEVASGNGYITGGKQIGTQAVTQDNANDEGKFDGDDVTWSSSTITARGAVIYKYNATASLAHLIAYLDFSTDQSSSSGDFKIAWHVDGIVNIG